MHEAQETLETYHRLISNREQMLYSKFQGPGPISCAYHLAHARKEWGHASRFPQFREFHLEIVGLDRFDERMQEYEIREGWSRDLETEESK